MPERIAVVRHGDYEKKGFDAPDNITEKGRKQTQEAAILLKEFLGEELCQPGLGLVISSQARRAIQTADIIAEELGLLRISHEAIGDKDGTEYRGDWIEKRLKSFLDPIGGYKALVLVTHRDQTSYLPKHLDPKIRSVIGWLSNSCAYALEPNTEEEKGWEVSVLRVKRE